MRVLITGVSGFVGKHLAHRLEQADVEIHGTVFPAADPTLVNVQQHPLDLRNDQAIHALIDAVQPDQIYHLAAQSSPAESMRTPWETIHNNVRAQHNLIQACLNLEQRPRVLIISSGDIYAPTNSDEPVAETSLILPGNAYAASKIAQDMMAQQASHLLPVLCARPFNHTGPGQREGFVAPDFAMQIVRIEAGLQPPTIQVRNLQAQVDFTDVRDVITAYQLIMERGTAGAVYNIAAGTAYSIQWLLDTLVEHSHLSSYPEVIANGQQSPSLKLGDASLLRSVTGWQPTIPFRQTLLDLLNDCRQRLHQ